MVTKSFSILLSLFFFWNVLFSQASLKIMSFNIRLNVASDSANAWPFRKEMVQSMIQYYQADLLGVQEALENQMHDLKQLLPGFGWHGIPRDTGLWGEYSAIFYRKARLQLERGGTFWLSETPDEASKGWDAALNRIASWAIFRDKIGGKRFLYINTHFDHKGEVARLKSAILLKMKSNDLNPENLPVILSGDFNFTPEKPPYSKLTEADGFIDARLHSLQTPHGPVSTWSGFRFPGVPGRRIDYIFFRGNLSILSYATLSDSWSGRYPSDHLPVMAEVLIDPPRVLLQGHAHNDYAHERPLFDALENGFNSVEVDVWFIDNRMVVSHDRPVHPANKPDIQSLYLEPLALWASQRKGRIYPQCDKPFFLMIDLKNEGEKTYAALKELLQQYRWLLEGKSAAIQIFLSGDRPIALAQNDPEPLMSIDGRPEDLNQGYSSHFMPVISQRFGKVVNWNGKGRIPAQEQKKLESLVRQVHAEGKQLRLWASPETEATWRLLKELGVDLINTDDLVGLRSFLLED